ncbi:MAG: class I SAM-dependent methyltransferase [Clostridiales bacterium]|nr:class I SAM-dependent methyltransferase [Eubacteriales bacterium]MDH7566986.1 class I SAM-dependent methyltransferase [Clostridiales bacterium]
MYTDFAHIYDRLMYDVDYGTWADYIEGIFHKNGLKPSLLLDLGCGTGSFCIEMAKRGYDMIGIDLSNEMLWCAKQKSVQENLDILFLNQDMTRFELYGTVDAVVCLMDSLNYITDKRGLKRVFKLVENYLNPGGLFIFDVNTVYKFENILKDNIFFEIGDDITYIWENHYDRKRKICRFDLTFFVKEGQAYRKFEETHFERAFSADELKKIISESGLELAGILDEMSFHSFSAKKSKRAFFVCRK